MKEAIFEKIELMYAECSKIVAEEMNELIPFILGQGAVRPKVMLIGQVPGPKEEASGQVFSGKARDHIVELLSSLKVEPEEVYSSYFIKYRPSKVSDKGRIVARPITSREKEIFTYYLEKEIYLIDPDIIIAFGNVTLQCLAKDPKITINTSEDQMYVIEIKDKSYKMYPMNPPGYKSFEKSLDKLIKEDEEKILKIINQPNKNKKQDKEVAKAFIQEGNEQRKISSLIERKDKNFFTKSVRQDIRVYERLIPKNFDKLLEKRKTSQTISIIYAGEGFADDPVITAINKVAKVFDDLDFEIFKIELYKREASLLEIIEKISSSRGLVIADTIEWYGISARLQDLFDGFFFHADDKLFKGLHLMPIVIARQANERQAYRHIVDSWEALGGLVAEGVEAVFKTNASLETNFEMLDMIEKIAEDYYRHILRYQEAFPRSQSIGKIAIEIPVRPLLLGENDDNKPIEGQIKKDDLLKINHDVKTEKKHIQAISGLLKNKFRQELERDKKSYPEIFTEAYKGKNLLRAKIQIEISGNEKDNFIINLTTDDPKIYFGNRAEVDLYLSLTRPILQKIISGNLSFQRAFMMGQITARGNFTYIHKLDNSFDFRGGRNG